MSEQFNSKDYSEYFSAVEKSIERESVKKSRSSDTVNTPKPKAVCGGIIRLRPWVYVAALALIVVLVLIIALPKGTKLETEQNYTSIETDDFSQEVPKQQTDYFAASDGETAQIEGDIESQSIIMINCNTNKVVAARNATEKCYPASTTKIMTVLTAVDYIKDYNQTFTFSFEITDPLYIAEATMAGFADGEAANMTDMLYGAILPSGADATVGIATKIAGGENEFVKLMNKKAKELGLKNTNFTNTSGLLIKTITPRQRIWR